MSIGHFYDAGGYIDHGKAEPLFPVEALRPPTITACASGLRRDKRRADRPSLQVIGHDRRAVVRRSALSRLHNEFPDFLVECLETVS